MSKLEDVSEQTSVTKTYYRRGSWAEPPAGGGCVGLGAKPPEAEQFFVKKSYFNAIRSRSACVCSHLKKLDF